MQGDGKSKVEDVVTESPWTGFRDGPHKGDWDVRRVCPDWSNSMR